jgi:transcriptional regulator with XRE-family HTH domain
MDRGIAGSCYHGATGDRASRYLGLGMSQRAVARRMGLNARTIRRWLSDVPGFPRARGRTTAHQVEEDATDVLYDLLNSSDERVRLAAARELRRVRNPSPPVGDDADLLTGWE